MAINSITEQDLEYFMNSGRLNAYQSSAIKSAIYPGRGASIGLMYVALKLNGEAGELAEHVGKALRDDGFGSLAFDEEGNYTRPKSLTPERRAQLIKELGDILWYVAAAAGELEIQLYDVALENLKKLKSRSDRGKLQGSGDDR